MALLTVDEAQARVLSGIDPTGIEWVDIAAAAGRTLATDLRALRTQPPSPLSAMDGYAVRLASIERNRDYPVLGESAAGRGFAGAVGAGEAVRIFTGAPLPEGADTVIIQENAVRAESHVRFTDLPVTGRNVRPRGIDFSEGAVGLLAGTVLTAGAVGLAAAMNHGRVPVRRRPAVAILSTGDELSLPGSLVPDDGIIASNGLMLAELVRRAGGTPIDLGLARDDLDTITGRIRVGLEAGADVVCLSGGASVGDHDLTRPAFIAEGFDIEFWKIAARPGKPVLFGRRGPVAGFGLPGNPVSSLVTGLLYLQPLIRALAGQRNPLPAETRARLAVPMGENDSRRDFVRAVLAEGADGLEVRPVENQDSSLLSMLAAADALIVRAEHAPAAAVGDRVDVIRM
jgi:molybdopterin molybdotransferase